MLYAKNEAHREATAPIPDSAMNPGLQEFKMAAAGVRGEAGGGKGGGRHAHGSAERVEGSIADDRDAAVGPLLIGTKNDLCRAKRNIDENGSTC
jgi:hypothetical protein